MKNLLFIALLLFSITECLQAQNLTVRKIAKNENLKEVSERSFRVTVGGGYAYRLGKIENSGDKGLDDFSRSLRNGYNLDLELQYFFKENWGIALNANLVNQSKREAGVLNLPALGSVSNYRETNRFIYIGPSFVMRYENNKFGLYMNAGFGPIFYTNTGEVISLEAEISKTIFGSYLGIAGEYRISPYVGAGLKLSATAGSVDIPQVGKQNTSNLIVTGFISFRTK